MSDFLLSRRSLSRGSLALLLGGSAIPAIRAAAQEATAATGGDFASLGLPALDITVTADGFDGAPSGEIAAGRYLLTATIAPDVEFGSAAFISPPPGMTAEDFLTQAGIGGGMPPADMEGSPEPMAEGSPAAGAEGGEEEEMIPLFIYQATFAGGASGPGGSTAQAVIDLPAGEWILWSDDPIAPQIPVTFTVTGDMPADLPTPDASLTFTLIDFQIMVDGDLTAGDHVALIQNHGAQPHFVIVMKGPDSMTNDQISMLLTMEMDGATPAALPFDPEKDLMPVAQTATQSIGTDQWVMMPLEAGTYAALCFFPTAGEGLPHAAHGMHTVFTVT